MIEGALPAIVAVRLGIVAGIAAVSAMWCASNSALAESGTTKDRLARAEAIAGLATPAPMVMIPAGRFLMGSPRLDATFGLRTPYDDTEIPQRNIWLDRVRDRAGRGQREPVSALVAWVGSGTVSGMAAMAG